jgi:hypothetical protein
MYDIIADGESAQANTKQTVPFPHAMTSIPVSMSFHRSETTVDCELYADFRWHHRPADTSELLTTSRLEPSSVYYPVFQN